LRRASCFSERVTKLRLAGLLLIAGGAITFALHALEAPEHLYRWLYDHLLSGLDVPDEPSQGSIDAIGYVSLAGGILELVVGAGLLAWDALRAR
jgi:hypothetical protein